MKMIEKTQYPDSKISDLYRMLRGASILAVTIIKNLGRCAIVFQAKLT